MALDDAEIRRRLPALALIDDDRCRRATAAVSAQAPAYFWTVPASQSGRYHHPACRADRGLWAHTLLVAGVVAELAPSYREQGLIAPEEADFAIAAAIVHDQRKYGDGPEPNLDAHDGHDERMATVVRASPLDDRIADAVAAHMGPWHEGPDPCRPLERLVHTADVIAS
ncbi:MAG: HD domain-containing protein, partial [Halococcoides sp.]